MKFPRSLARLGQVLDLHLERDGRFYELRWRSRPRPWLCSDPVRELLWIMPDPETDLEELEDDDRPAARLCRRWSDLPEQGASPFTVKVRNPPVFKGNVLRIGYRSDKWSGNRTDYTHRFVDAPRLVRAGDVYRISGGTFRVTARGIVR